MKRWLGFLIAPAWALLAVLSGACGAGAPTPAPGPGQELMVCCCFDDYSRADAHAKRIGEAVPGAAVRIGAKDVEDGSGRKVFEVYASHPDMTPEALAERLARFNCPILGGL